MRWWWGGSVLLVLLLGLVSRVTAAPPLGAVLVVSLRDEHGTGLADVTVLIRDAAGSQLIQRATTDATGMATVPELAAGQVRVAVQGRVAGLPLFLAGAEVDGIKFTLHPGTNRLDLRAEASGLVRPDPGTMIAGDQPVPVPDGVAAAMQATLQTLPLLPPAPPVAPPLAEGSASPTWLSAPSADLRMATAPPSRAEAGGSALSPAPRDAGTATAPRALLHGWVAWLLMGCLLVLAVATGQIWWRGRNA
ncbi:carboxypeptidase regulatory-like domain-containing protein [Candidatus Chloroploca asiatica]|uniref:Carboxypeptidase regulatory-like domain-containing protein n=1 Tax=Candidatus Chloroploca asiatica TaxID=1506545 RepID=A0A2H3KJB3_9CHLR|nr:carboxypeptidase regulatory-like domain-containing protein [Candidatus Chloroploca asiatica]PDV97994.1 hypothetical protein A9Q02_16510 [Candidatus Chloroploca asiatica]